MKKKLYSNTDLWLFFCLPICTPISHFSGFSAHSTNSSWSLWCLKLWSVRSTLLVNQANENRTRHFPRCQGGWLREVDGGVRNVGESTEWGKCLFIDQHLAILFKTMSNLLRVKKRRCSSVPSSGCLVQLVFLSGPWRPFFRPQPPPPFQAPVVPISGPYFPPHFLSSVWPVWEKQQLQKIHCFPLFSEEAQQTLQWRRRPGRP